MKKMNEKGFTLVELIVVMAVLAVISAIAVPRFLGVQKDAKVEADYATAAMLGKAAELYLVKEGNTTADLDAAALGGTLDEKLKTTEIKFVSENYIGQEDSITFDESTGGTITVSAVPIGEGATAVPLYPR
jgi:type IV pilus assembly protein PilA